MNPTLTQWLNDYHSARAQFEADRRHAEFLPELRVPPRRPTEMQFTITTTGLLRDHAGARMGHVSEMSQQALATIGVDRDRLTARQRRTPMPRRNPDTTRQPTVVEEVAAENGVTIPTLEQMAATAEQERTGWDIDAIPGDAAPGDVVTAHGQRVGIVGRNGRNEVIVLRDPNPMHTRLRRNRQDEEADAAAIMDEAAPIRGLPDDLQPATGTPAVTGLDLEGERTLMQNLTAAMSQPYPLPNPALNLPPIDLSRITAAADRMGANMAGMAAALRAPAPARTGEAELYQGPRMLATLGVDAGAAELFTRHTATGDAAAARAAAIFPHILSYGVMARRSRDNDTTGTVVDRNAAAANRFLIRGYGLELNEEALTAVTAMTTYMIRHAAGPLTQRAEAAEETLRVTRGRLADMTQARDALRDEVRDLQADAQARGTITNGVIDTSTATPPAEQVRAAKAAAKAWAETGIEDSVAKLASFRHLLDTLNAMA